MEQCASNYQQKQKWYNRHIFPLVPVISTKKRDEHNTKGFSFKWLIFSFWSLDHFSFEVSVNIDTHWGVGFAFILPYLRGVVAIPCPQKLDSWIDKNLRRKPKPNTKPL
jgi:hypothetical protein